MQLTIDIPNQPLYDKILWFLNKLRDDRVEIVTTSKEKSNIDDFKSLDKNLELDPYFYKRQDRVVKLREDIKSDNMPLVDFDNSIEHFKTLQGVGKELRDE